MRIRKLLLCLMLICSMLSTNLYPAHASATQSGNKIAATIDDWRHVSADNSALVAEVAVLSKSLQEEREQTRQVLMTTKDLRESDAKEIALLKEQIGLVGKAKYQEGRSDGIKIGAVLGILIGAGLGIAVSR